MSLEQTFTEQSTTTVFKGDIQFTVGDETILASDLATIDQVNTALDTIKGTTGTLDNIECKSININGKSITGVFSADETESSTDTYIYTQQATYQAISNKQLWEVIPLGGLKPKTNNPIEIPSLSFNSGDVVSVTSIVPSDKKNVFSDNSLPTTKYVRDNIDDGLTNYYTSTECDNKYALKSDVPDTLWVEK